MQRTQDLRMYSRLFFSPRPLRLSRHPVSHILKDYNPIRLTVSAHKRAAGRLDETRDAINLHLEHFRGITTLLPSPTHANELLPSLPENGVDRRAQPLALSDVKNAGRFRIHASNRTSAAYRQHSERSAVQKAVQ